MDECLLLFAGRDIIIFIVFSCYERSNGMIHNNNFIIFERKERNSVISINSCNYIIIYYDIMFIAYIPLSLSWLPLLVACVYLPPACIELINISSCRYLFWAQTVCIYNTNKCQMERVRMPMACSHFIYHQQKRRTKK